MADTRANCRKSQRQPFAHTWLYHVCCVLALLLLTTLPYDALAASTEYNYTSSNTSGVTDLQVAQDFSCNADGSASGQLFVNPKCNMTGVVGIFSNVVCRVENIFGMILGLVYCAIQAAFLKPLLGILTLYITIYGALVLTGKVQHSFSDAVWRIVKIGLVAAIAMNAHIAIGVGYKFFVSAAQTSIGIVFEVFSTDGGDGIYAENPAMQQMVASGYMASPSHPDESKAFQGGEHWLANFDATINRIMGFFVESGVGFLIVMLGLFIFMPPLFLVVVYLIVSVISAFVLAIIGYLRAMLGITFLFMLAPLFVCFALFSVTSAWFETWLRYLAGFTIQLTIVFTFFMFVLMIDLVTFFQNIGAMVRNYQFANVFGFIPLVGTAYSLCKPWREGGSKSGEILYFQFDAAGNLTEPAENGQYSGFPRCIDEYDISDILPDTFAPPEDRYIPDGMDGLSTGLQQRPPLNFDPEAAEELLKLADAINAQTNGAEDGTLLPFPHAESMPKGYELLEQIIADANRELVISFFDLPQHADLIFFLLVRFIVVIILTYLLNHFMKRIPEFAEALSGTKHIGAMSHLRPAGQSATSPHQSVDFAGTETAFARFKKAAFSGGYFQKGFIRTAPARFIRGVGAAMGGAAESITSQSLIRAGSLGRQTHMGRELGMATRVREDAARGGGHAAPQRHRGLHSSGRTTKNSMFGSGKSHLYQQGSGKSYRSTTWKRK